MELKSNSRAAGSGANRSPVSRWMRCAIVAVIATAGFVRAEDWPRFLGPTGNGHSVERNLLGSFPKGGPVLVFSKEVGTGYSAPSIVGNELILHHRSGSSEIVESMNATNGNSNWKHAYPTEYVDPYGYNNGPRSTPTVTANRVYAFGAEGRLLCLDRSSGKVIWERNTQKDWEVPSAFFGVGSTPLLVDGKLIVMVGGQPNSGVVAFDPESGKTLWESVGQKNWEGTKKTGWPGEPEVIWNKSDKQASYSSPVAATIHGRRHILCLMRQGLVSLNPTNGEVQFQFWFRSRVNESVNAMNPVVLGDHILISAAYYRVGSVLLKVHPDGKGVDEVRRDLSLEVHWMTPVLDSGKLYAFSGRNEPDARLRCVDFMTGKVLWDRDESWQPHSAEQPPVFGRGSFVAADGRLFALGEGGMLGIFKINPERLEELDRFQVPQLGYPCWAAPVLSNGLLYLRNERRLICYRVKNS